MTLRTILVLLPALLGAPAFADETGSALFEANCSGCHQAGGVGMSGLAPPLVDPALWQGLGAKAPDYLAGILVGGLTGTITVNGERFIGLAMPPQDYMSDAEMLAVSHYVLNDLNGLDLSVSVEAIVARRADRPSHADLRAIRKEAIP